MISSWTVEIEKISIKGDDRIRLHLEGRAFFAGMTLDTLCLRDHSLDEWRRILQPGRMLRVWSDSYGFVYGVEIFLEGRFQRLWSVISAAIEAAPLFYRPRLEDLEGS